MLLNHIKNLLLLGNIKTRVFYFSSGFVIYGEILNFFIEDFNLLVFISSMFTSFIVGLIIFLRAKHFINNVKAFFIGVYTLLFDTIITIFANLAHESFYAMFIRSCIIGFVLVPYAGFYINKLHSIIIGTIMFIVYCISSFLSEDTYLIKNIALIFVAEFVFVYGVYMIISYLTYSIRLKEDLLQKAELANSKLKTRESELKELNNGKNTLLSLISHDLRGPFNNIIGFVDLLDFAIVEKDWNKTEKYHSRISQSVKITFNLLRNLTDWASTQYDEIHLNKSDIELPQLIEKIIVLNANVIKNKKLNVKVDMSNDFQINADENMVLSIFRNLLSNAIKFSPVEGNILIGLTQKADTTVFFVQDSGQGVPKDKLHQLFSGRLQKSTPGTLSEMGSGLGLSICRKFIDKHEGSIWAEIIQDIGFAVCFCLYSKIDFENEEFSVF